MTLTNRKFVQSMFVQFTAAAGLFFDKIDGGTLVALSTLALSIYAMSNVMDKKNGGAG